MANTPQDPKIHYPSKEAESHDPSQPHQPPSKEETEKWGTHIMGSPAAPTVHPDNQKAASWNAADHQQIYQQPYLVYSPIEKPTNNPLEPVIQAFNTWSRKAEDIARNIWHNLTTGPSVSEAAWGKVNLTAKAITEGGFESLYKHIFETDPNEKLKKTFACYLSTSTGPVAGTLYLSTARVAFCSDRPLSFMAPSGQETWCYYKVMIPLNKIAQVNPVVMKENPPEKYIQMVTVDGHDFWFMGFVNFEKACHHLLDAVSSFRATATAVVVLTVHIRWVMESPHFYSTGTNILDMVSPSWVLSFYTKVISSAFSLQSGRPTTGLDIITNTLQATLSKERETQNTTKTQLSLY